jgi:hypothetical protein
MKIVLPLDERRMKIKGGGSGRIVGFKRDFFGDVGDAGDTAQPEAVTAEANPVVAVATLAFGLVGLEAPEADAAEGEDESIVPPAVTPAAPACFKIAHLLIIPI